MTGVRVRETLPDQLVAAADDVVLVDITPHQLIDRLQAGKVYKPEAIQQALDNFFKVENLSALREVALRQVAEEVEAKRIPSSGGIELRYSGDRLIRTAPPQQIGERLLALVTPKPEAQRTVRRAWRSAQRLGADLDILWVYAREPGTEEHNQIEALRRLASVLGAHLLTEPGDDVVAVTQRVVRERGITYILMGTPRQRVGIARLFKPGLPQRLIRGLPGIDLRIVADRARTERPTWDRNMEQTAAERMPEPVRSPEPQPLPGPVSSEPPGDLMESVAGRMRRKLAHELHEDSESEPPKAARSRDGGR